MKEIRAACERLEEKLEVVIGPEDEAKNKGSQMCTTDSGQMAGPLNLRKHVTIFWNSRTEIEIDCLYTVLSYKSLCKLPLNHIFTHIHINTDGSNQGTGLTNKGNLVLPKNT